MADLNDPSPPPVRADFNTSPPSNRAATGIKTTPNGRAAIVPDTAADPFPLRLWLLNIGAQIVVGLFIALLIALGLVFFSGLPFFKSFGIGVVLSVVLTLLIQRWVTWPIPKEVLAKQHQLPPGVHPTDGGGREVVETVVFVVVLVLLLKSFAAEAFVIPTGSMAETLWGYQKVVECPSCGHEFSVNCSQEVDPSEGEPVPIQGCTCPNCRQVIRLVRKDRKDLAGNYLPPREGLLDGSYREIADPGWKSGDRVLVGKLLPFVNRVSRLDVVVFKYPKGPQKNTVAMNYIKRLIGLAGETIAIHAGDLYILAPEHLAFNDDGVPRTELWKSIHEGSDEARALFKAGKFGILRKPPDIMLSMMRPVYDNDHQARDLKGKDWQRWTPDDDGWEATDEGRAFRSSGARKDLSWLRYGHKLRETGGKRTLITDFMGYNSGEGWDWHNGGWHEARFSNPPQHKKEPNGVNWVGDLLLDCEVDIDKGEGELVLELVRGEDRFRAVWDLASDDGRCTLYRAPSNAPVQEMGTKLDSQPTKLRTGTYRLRFANFDQRLTVWVDGSLPFDDGVRYTAPKSTGATAHDLSPVSIGAGSGATVRKIKLYRDTYYSQEANKADESFDGTNAERFVASLRDLPVKTLYVQPSHYLCLGDNSMASSDGRDWGLVPDRLLLGRAVLVYYPLGRVGRIR